MVVCVDGGTDRQMKEWMDGQMDGWLQGLGEMHQYEHSGCQDIKILPC